MQAGATSAPCASTFVRQSEIALPASLLPPAAVHFPASSPSSVQSGSPATKPVSPAQRMNLSPKRRKDEHLKNVKAHLLKWRREAYRGTSLKADNVLPDRALQTIASNRRGIKTIEDLRPHLKPPWPLLDAHGTEVLQLVKKLDEEDAERRRECNLQAREARKQAAQEGGGCRESCTA